MINKKQNLKLNKRSRRFQMFVSVIVLIALVTSITLFSVIVEHFVYRSLLTQTHKDNTTIGRSILQLVDQSKHIPNDSLEYIELLRRTCNILELPNDGYMCVVDSNGLVIAAPNLSLEKHIYITSADFVSPDRKTKLNFKQFFSTDNFNGFYEYPSHDYSDVLAALNLERFDLKLLIHQNNVIIREAAQNKSLFIRIAGIAIAFLISILVYFVLNRRIGKYQFEINRKNNKLEGALSRIKIQNEKLNKVLHENQALTGIMAHDLKSPLHNIESLNEILTQTSHLDEPQKEIIQYSNQSVKAGLNLIKDILSLSRLEQRPDDIVLTEIDVRQFIEEKVAPFIKSAAQKQISFNIVNNIDEQTIKSDYNTLSRILENLISNAVKYTLPQKQISIEFNAVAEYYNFIIKDEGQGFREEDLPKLYGKFEKLASSPTGGESSTGLGLYITKLLIDKLDCSIELETEWGVGSTFTITHPKFK